MARPVKQAQDRRDFRLNLRLSLIEREALVYHADQAGLTSSEYLRRQIPILPGHGRGLAPVFEAPRHSPPSIANARLIHELNAIGVNLNQIARYLNTGLFDRVDGFDRVLISLEHVIDHLIEESAL